MTEVPNWEFIDKIEGWLFKEEAELLYKYARELDDFEYWVEIGSYKGKSTLVLCEAHPFGVAIDPFFFISSSSYPDKSWEKEFRDNTSKYRDLLVLKGNSTDQLILDCMQDIMIGLAYIDGEHSYEAVKKDFTEYSKFLGVGDHVIFHDAWGENGEEEQTPLAEVTKFIKELRQNPGWKEVEKCRRIAVFQKL